MGANRKRILIYCYLFLLVGNYAFLALAVASMLLFAINAPAKIKLDMLLQMDEEEIN